MAYYVLENKQGYTSDPGFMQNITALSDALGKKLNKDVYKDAADKNGLIPEYKVDDEGKATTEYKSPALVSQYYKQGAPGNPKTNKDADPNNLSKSIQAMIAKQASDEAMKQAGSMQVDGGPAGVPRGTIQNADGSLQGPDGNSIGEVAPGTAFSPVNDPQKVYLDAIQQQAKDNPAVAKSLKLPAPSSKQVKLKGTPPAGAVKYSPSTGKYFDAQGNELK